MLAAPQAGQNVPKIKSCIMSQAVAVQNNGRAEKYSRCTISIR